MTAVAFDTLKFSRALREKANLPTEQADGFAEAIAETIQSDLATKTDIEALRLSTKTDLQTLRGELRESELRLEARIEAAKADTVKWVLSAIGFQTVAIVGAIVALARVLQP